MAGSVMFRRSSFILLQVCACGTTKGTMHGESGTSPAFLNIALARLSLSFLCLLRQNGSHDRRSAFSLELRELVPEVLVFRG